LPPINRKASYQVTFPAFSAAITSLSRNLGNTIAASQKSGMEPGDP